MTDAPAPSAEVLPDLPRPRCNFADHSYPAFTASQMRTYAIMVRDEALLTSTTRVSELEAENARLREGVPSAPTRRNARKVFVRTWTLDDIIAVQSAARVCICTEHGWWRENASGYALSIEGAGVYTGSDAIARTKHCGPEKQVGFAILDDAALAEKAAVKP